MQAVSRLPAMLRLPKFRFQYNILQLKVALVGTLVILMVFLGNFCQTWDDSKPSFFALCLVMGGMVGSSGLLMVAQANAVSNAIAKSSPVNYHWWWAIEFRGIARQVDAYRDSQMADQQALASANAELEKIYRSLRHDTASVIGGILNMFAMLRDMKFQPGGEYAAIFDLAEQKANIAYELVSKTGGFGAELNIAQVEIATIFDDLKIVFAGNNVAFKYPEQPIAIMVDKAAFELKVMGNLITNAIKYSNPPNEEVTVGVKQKPDELVVYVRDNGMGLSESEAERVLNGYGQNARLNPNIPGSGTGLHSAQGMLKRLGFSLGVKSQKGYGSIFFVKIPIKNE
jgi:two-component system, chemotaxis family, sensor kinase Cph1